MKTLALLLFSSFATSSIWAASSDSTSYRLRLNLPLLDLPQNMRLPYHAPSMYQSMEWSRSFYELGFWGIDALGNSLFIPDKTRSYSSFRRFSNAAFKYALGLAFSKYGSELPIPLGVWAHEEFHRATLGVKAIDSENGNWLLRRWDGTVYGISDPILAQLKTTDLNQLLYAYTAGVQYEILLNQKISQEDFFLKRSHSKNALLLYNAYYVYNYFHFATSSLSDSVKVLAPPHEDPDPAERDFAGADLTAWAYDMFNPSQSFMNRDSFPNGQGVNRRIGFSELTPEAQEFLQRQEKLSLLNFVNPAFFFINRIPITPDLSFNFFAQYAPTHFGNDLALYLPIAYKKIHAQVNVHEFNSKTERGFGIGLGVYQYPLSTKISFDASLNYWNQPDTYFGTSKKSGGSFDLQMHCDLGHNFSAYTGVSAKTKGWQLGNPYLSENIAAQIGIRYDLRK